MRDILVRIFMRAVLPALLIAVAAGYPARAADTGRRAEIRLKRMSLKLFGVEKPLFKPADASDEIPRAQSKARDRVKLAPGLRAAYVARNVARWGDQLTLWPDDANPTHIVLCVEQSRAGTTPMGNLGMNTSVQRVRLSDGLVETILHGLSHCDGIRTTPWGTILITEEASPIGRAFELLDPLAATDHWAQSLTHGVIRDAIDSPTASTLIVRRYEMGEFAWEGLAILPSGVVIAGDEERPGSGAIGGSIYKFIPSSLWVPGDPPISDLSQSPFVSGTLYVLRIGDTDWGQGNQRGRGRWLGPVDWGDPLDPNALDSRAWAKANGATGFYRPEDMDLDPYFAGPGARVFWNNTGNKARENWGETLSLVDPAPEDPNSTPVVQLFVAGNGRLNSADNIAVQPGTGNVFILEDDQYGEVWACLRDGRDRDLFTDGCISVMSVTDPHGEPSGLIFDRSGKTAYMMIQHGSQDPSLLDFVSNPINGETDDLIKITGFQIGN